MKKENMKRIVSVITLVGLSLFSFAIKGDHWDENKKTHTAPRAAAECAPATTVGFLAYNNVNALIETGGSLWQDRPNSAAGYEVPAGSGKTSIYAGALWMGGTDINDQLKIAAVTFRQGGTNDFWTGPLRTDGSAEISPDVCRDYDNFFHITRQEVVDFNDWWRCTQGPLAGRVGCEGRDFSGYSVPKVITEWPAHGDEARGQDFYLAPFYDNDGDGLYNPGSGDYPYYDLTGDIDCRAVRDIRLFGDDTYWWVFNDKGNIHTSTNSQSIGMEIRAQAFAFATNDEVNDMTFYNYELINRSTFTLFNTYFGQWVDPDLGCSNDDYVGCDVGRGLGFCYNGDQFDEDCNGVSGYADLPAAVGVDFFEGPYQDNDGQNNLVGIGLNEALNGIGYLDLSLPKALQDSIIDNERYGMRRFVYYDRGTDPRRGDAFTALHHYNYLRSIWKDGAKMVYGGNGHPTDPQASDLECDFMFPGQSDPLNWGTRGEDPGTEWTEITAGNPPFDRRFIQSAGPFTLKPGAVNDITVGVVWAQAASGNNYASVEKMINSDRKAQALFDNCFDVLDGPDAPDLEGVELNKELVLFITNKQGVSNNFKKYPGDYEEEDPFIITPDGEDPYDNKYRFQGYMIYQVADATVSVSDLTNLDKARLAFQCDVKDDVADLINFEFDDELNASVPVYKVRNAENKGIRTSFRVDNDLFATDDPRLVNFKTYYFIAIAYAYNNYKEYVQDDPTNSDGQKLPFISSRKSTSGSIQSVSFTPHPQEPKYGGMRINGNYGSEPEITRVEGRGNGGNALAFTPETLEDLIMNSTTPGMNQPTYKAGAGPISVKVVDPTNVIGGNFTMKFYNDIESGEYRWKAWRFGDGPAELNDTVYSQTSVDIQNEQIVKKWGVSIATNDVVQAGEVILAGKPDDLPASDFRNGYISSSITYADSSKRWLSGVQDVSGSDPQNWIRSGTDFENSSEDDPSGAYIWNSTWEGTQTGNEPEIWFIDPNKTYEGIIDGTWAPFKLVHWDQIAPEDNNRFTRRVYHAPGPAAFSGQAKALSDMRDLKSVDIIITNDKDKWTRCPVVETQDDPTQSIGNAGKLRLRNSPSVDKEGMPDGTGDGMGWFPGYAVDVETGERLNMAFGEDSWMGDQNGTDMKWNPTATFEAGLTEDPNNPDRREVKWGGKHYVWVFGNGNFFRDKRSRITIGYYDEGATLKAAFDESTSDNVFAEAWSHALWVGMPMLEKGTEFMATDVTLSFRVDRTYNDYESDSLQNNGLPMYRWDMESLSTDKYVNGIAKNALDMIRVVPNPYYAFSEHYETNQLDNYVKITNLPERCTVSIYNVSGTLIRKFNKADPSTEILWDLVNQSNVPISSGVYLVHVDAPGIGEIIVKWFGVLRPTDLQGF